MVCHSFVCLSLPMEISCSSPSREDMLFCHIMFVASHRSYAGTIIWMLFVRYNTLASATEQFSGAARGQVFSRSHTFSRWVGKSNWQLSASLNSNSLLSAFYLRGKSRAGLLLTLK